MIDIIPEIMGEVEYQRYSVVEDRINLFTNSEVIGVDESGVFDMYAIHLGNTNKPTIYFQSSIHGSEWKTTQYGLSFFEKLRDDSYPNKNFRDLLLENFHLVYVPVVNPYGYDQPLDETGEQIRKDGRENVNGIDLNRNFDDRTEQETKNIISVIEQYNPIACIDMHLRTVKGSNLELHSSHYETEHVREKIATMWQNYTGETLVVNSVSGSSDPSLWDRGLFINYVRNNIENPYTPYTLAYLTEIGQYDNREGGNTNRETYNYGMSSLYAFLFNVINYYIEYNEDFSFNGDTGQVYKVQHEHKTIYLFRDLSGKLIRLKEVYEWGTVILTTIKRDQDDNIVEYIRKKFDE